MARLIGSTDAVALLGRTQRTSAGAALHMQTNVGTRKVRRAEQEKNQLRSRRCVIFLGFVMRVGN